MTLLTLLRSATVARPRGVVRQAGPAAADLRITRAGGEDGRTLTATTVAASWTVTPPGTLSATVTTADLLAVFGTVDLRGRWVRWEHPTAGAWGGVVTLCRPQKSTGMTELGGRDFSFLFHRKRTAKDYDLNQAPAGSHVHRVVADASRVQALWLADTSIQETGAPLPLSARGEDVLSVLNRLAGESDQEWRVTPDRVLEWRARLGVDLSASVQLVEDIHIVDVDYPLDLEPVVNDLLAIPATAEYQRTNAVVVEDADAIVALGSRMQDTVVITDRISEGGMRPIAESLLQRLARQGKVMTLTVSDTDDCFSWAQEGDTVSLLLHSLNLWVKFRIMVRTLDLTTGLMIYTGDVLESSS